MTPDHVILGGGELGLLLAKRLVAAGERARAIPWGDALLPPGVEPLLLGAGGELPVGFAAGAAALYLLPGARPPPRLSAAEAPHRVVILEAEPGLAPEAPPGVPRFLARTAARFGPGERGGAFGAAFWSRALHAAAVELPGDPDAAASFAYTEDVVDGLARLGAAPAAAAGPWTLPALDPIAPRALANALAGALGLRVALRSKAPHRVPAGPPDADRFLATFGGRTTPLRAAALRTAAWAQQAFAAA